MTRQGPQKTAHTVRAGGLAGAALLLLASLAPGQAGRGSSAALDPQLPIIPEGTVSRALTWENKTGEPGRGGMSRAGRKGSPCIPHIGNGQTVTLMDVKGPGVVRHIWITIPDRSPEAMRNMILRMYWDGSSVPSVEAPLGDFFAVAMGRTAPLTSHFVTQVKGRGFNCFFPMPFNTQAKITVQNDMSGDKGMDAFFFQIDYELRDALPANTGLFHAQFRRENPTVEKRDFVILDEVQGPGMLIGCVIGIRPVGPDWWGEGEMKFYMDGDTEFPTICGTGTEDYFGGAWGMEEFQTPYQGCPLHLGKDDYEHGAFSLYRWHAQDPVYFRSSFKATMQQLGHKNGLFERSDDWCSDSYWYQLKPVQKQPPFPDRAARIANLVAAKK
jgi:hypothetical protein